MDYHLIDDQHIEILAGDIAKGLWNFAGDTLSKDGEKEVRLKSNTKSMQIRLKRQVGRLDTLSAAPVSGIMGVAMSTIWGPTGGLAGTALGIVAGKDDFLCIGCQLNDGRKFIAFMRKTAFDSWTKACPDAKVIEKKEEKKKLFGIF